MKNFLRFCILIALGVLLWKLCFTGTPGGKKKYYFMESADEVEEDSSEEGESSGEAGASSGESEVLLSVDTVLKDVPVTNPRQAFWEAQRRGNSIGELELEELRSLLEKCSRSNTILNDEDFKRAYDILGSASVIHLTLPQEGPLTQLALPHLTGLRNLSKQNSKLLERLASGKSSQDAAIQTFVRGSAVFSACRDSMISALVAFAIETQRLQALARLASQPLSSAQRISLRKALEADLAALQQCVIDNLELDAYEILDMTAPDSLAALAKDPNASFSKKDILADAPVVGKVLLEYVEEARKSPDHLKNPIPLPSTVKQDFALAQFTERYNQVLQRLDSLERALR
ncbi:MAG: hypothetical protein IJJ26_00355 [Victivallales bacterium]|nr:hypothetical protein [Victivallales bacterium]